MSDNTADKANTKRSLKTFEISPKMRFVNMAIALLFIYFVTTQEGSIFILLLLPIMIIVFIITLIGESNRGRRLKLEQDPGGNSSGLL